MAIQEQWQTWRTQASPSVTPDEFVAWLDTYTSEAEDPEHLFQAWRDLPDHSALLKRLLAGEVLPLGTGPQLLAALFHAMYQTLCGRRAFITVSLHLDMVRTRAACTHLSRLGKLNIRLMGTLLDAGKVYLGDCQNVDIVIADYFELLASYRKNPQQFDTMVGSIFLLEADLALYNTRLILFERNIERAAGMVYKSSGSIPEQWKSSNDFIDVPHLLAEKTAIALAGCYSASSAYALRELQQLLGPTLARRIPAKTRTTPHTCLTYKTSQERVSALVSDVMKATGNALIVCSSEQLRQDLQEEFRKAGQPCTITARSVDIATFFAPVLNADGRRKVLIMRGLPSTLTLPDQPIADGALYLAEYFLCENMHEKVFAFAAGLFRQTSQPRVYFSLEDQMFAMYAEDAGFNRLFQLIDFTEKYDHWRQIRRVLAKSMAAKLHRLRTHSLDETAPLITMALNVSTPAMGAPKANRKTSASRMDALCFCGSGKPFRECHGKKLA